MMNDITIGKAEEAGIINKHSIMENGEKRFRQLCTKDNTAYIRTEGVDVGYWQKSHYHSSSNEVYIVQKGKMIFVQYINDKLEAKVLLENDICKTKHNIPHNIYMYPNTVLHTVKYGNIKESDWIPFEKLDDILKNKTINELE